MIYRVLKGDAQDDAQPEVFPDVSTRTSTCESVVEVARNASEDETFEDLVAQVYHFVKGTERWSVWE